MIYRPPDGSHYLAAIWNCVKSKKVKNLVFKFTYMSAIFVCKQLKSLSKNKANRLDELLTGMLKDSADGIVKPLNSHC